MEITTIESLRDNYIYILHDTSTRTATVVDPAEAAPVVKVLEELDAKLTGVLVTHHHFDHTGGISELLQIFPEAVVYGSASEGRIPGQKVFLKDGETFSVCGREVVVLDVHAHTRGHIAFFFPPLQEGDTETAPGELFSGDTIFGSTCGAIFEGSIRDMFTALKKIRELPQNTRIWCAHEYTLMYLPAALQMEPYNLKIAERLHRVQRVRERDGQTVPLLLEEEKETNPYLHWDSKELQNRFGTTDDDFATFEKICALCE